MDFYCYSLKYSSLGTGSAWMGERLGISVATGKSSGIHCAVPVSISGSASTSRSTSATTGDDKKEAEKMSWTEMRL